MAEKSSAGKLVHKHISREEKKKKPDSTIIAHKFICENILKEVRHTSRSLKYASAYSKEKKKRKTTSQEKWKNESLESE